MICVQQQTLHLDHVGRELKQTDRHLCERHSLQVELFSVFCHKVQGRLQVLSGQLSVARLLLRCVEMAARPAQDCSIHRFAAIVATEKLLLAQGLHPAVCRFRFPSSLRKKNSLRIPNESTPRSRGGPRFFFFFATSVGLKYVYLCLQPFLKRQATSLLHVLGTTFWSVAHHEVPRSLSHTGVGTRFSTRVRFSVRCSTPAVLAASYSSVV